MSLAFVVLCTALPAHAQTSPDTATKMISVAEADYPGVAKDAFVSGSVTLRVDVNDQGRATNAVVVSGPGSVCSSVSTPGVVALREAAVAATMNASYSPQPSIQMATVEFKSEPAPTADANPQAGPAARPAIPRNIGGGVLNGKATSLPTPEYPPAAKAVTADGSVSVQVLIAEDGSIYSAKAVSGHPLLRSAAVNAACSAKFAPTLLQGQPVKVSGVIVYSFNL